MSKLLEGSLEREKARFRRECLSIMAPGLITHDIYVAGDQRATVERTFDKIYHRAVNLPVLQHYALPCVRA